MITKGFSSRHRLRERLLASPHNTLGLLGTNKLAHEQASISTKTSSGHGGLNRGGWLGYQFLHSSRNGMRVLTNKLAGRPMVNQQLARSMENVRGTRVVRYSPSRARSE